MAVLVVTAPEPLVTLEEAKAHLRVLDTAEDGLIKGYIAAASASIDGPWGWLGQCIGPQIVEVRSNTFSGIGRLPIGPLISAASLKYVDADGAEMTLPEGEYILSEEGLSLLPSAAWPRLRGDANGVRLQYRAGFEEVPAPIKQAVLLMVGQWFRTRADAVPGGNPATMPNGARALLSPYWLRRV